MRKFLAQHKDVGYRECAGECIDEDGVYADSGDVEHAAASRLFCASPPTPPPEGITGPEPRPHPSKMVKIFAGRAESSVS